jgi:2-oxoglutarate ferredoxin oxidoreductase subunit alpha
MQDKTVLLQGNIACAMGALRAGATFFAGYPITPSTEIAEYMAARLPKTGGVFMQMEDEIASIGAMIGAAAVGHKAFTATSGPGFSLMQELIGYACSAELPLVIVNVMRVGPSTGLPTVGAAGDVMQARWGTHGDHAIIALCPSSVKETYTQTIRAFDLAVKYRNPVVLLLEEQIGHLREGFVPDGETAGAREIEKTGAPGYIPYENTASMVPKFVPLGRGARYHITGLTHDEEGFYTQNPDIVEKFFKRIHDKIECNKADICRSETYRTEDADVVIMAYGAVARSAHAAVNMLRSAGKKAGLLRLITIWPFDDETVARVCAGKKLVLMPEMNLGQLVREVERTVRDTPVAALSMVRGTLITPEQIAEKVAGEMRARGEDF